MAQSIKILCFHGLGRHLGTNWGETWRNAIEPGIGNASNVTLDFRFADYDTLFQEIDLDAGETMRAIWKLARSGLSSMFRRERGAMSDFADRYRWTAGYVVAWVEDAEFQSRTRKLVLETIADYQPDVVLAHSLGSLVTYNALSHADADAHKKRISKIDYVTFGSQIGNPFVVGNLTHGRILPLPVRHWHHLFNRADDVFTSEIALPGVSNFTQLLTPFDLAGIGDHGGEHYLGHHVTHRMFWGPLVDFKNEAPSRRLTRDIWAKAAPKTKRKPRRRALLIGIDEYPQESDRLFGCVNDVFSISATLQDCGFDPGEIRVCLNERATAEGISSRMDWLVDDAVDGDQLVFYYSGHGARLPEYGEFEEPDRMTETLVPYDFDWSPERSISDEQIFRFYSQLPYGLQFLMIIDACHSGDIHRQGAARAKGITPPDDIRHRELRWDSDEQMWVERDFAAINPEFGGDQENKSKYFGKDGATVRLGRAGLLRLATRQRYEKAKSTLGPVGPFLPLIIEACGEEERAYEYRHGVTSYGAFTFCLTSILRQQSNLTFDQLVELARDRLKKLGYRQTPQILGPTIYKSAPVPFLSGKGTRKAKGTLPGSATPRTTG